jgi:hypothetical protein
MAKEKTSNDELIDMFNKTLEDEFFVTVQKCMDSKDFDGLLVVAAKYQHYIKYYPEFKTVLALTVQEFEPKKREQVTKIAYEHFIELEKRLEINIKKFTPRDKARIIQAVREDFLWWVEYYKVLSQKDISYFWNMIKKAIPTRLPYYCPINGIIKTKNRSKEVYFGIT